MDAKKILGAVGLLLYLGVGVFPYLVSGLVAPAWGVAVLWVVWVIGLILGIRVFRTRPGWTLAFAPGAVVFWVAWVSLGDWAFGWTA